MEASLVGAASIWVALGASVVAVSEPCTIATTELDVEAVEVEPVEVDVPAVTPEVASPTSTTVATNAPAASVLG